MTCQYNNRRILVIIVLTVVCAHLYFIVFNQGVLMTLEDFYKQQLLFYRDGWEKLHTGQWTFWAWNNLLGNDYLASNSFYFTYSPFFWLAMLAPKMYLPQMMLLLNMLKMILAALFMVKYLKSIRITSTSILICGGLMYAFSGAMILNYFFNHFNDTFCLLPLFLLASENFIRKSKYKGLVAIFALQTMINVNFLYNLLIFISLYILMRYFMYHQVYQWRHLLKHIMLYLSSLILAIAIGMVNFLPTVLNLLHNPRVGTFSFSFQKMNIDYILTTILATINEWFFPPTSVYRDELLSEKMMGSFNFQSLTLFISTIAIVILPLMLKLLNKRQCIFIIMYFMIAMTIYIVPVLNSMATGFSNVTFRWGFIVCGLMIALACYLWQQLQVEHLGTLLIVNGVYIILATVVVVVTIQLQAYRDDSYYYGRVIYGIAPTFIIMIGLCITIIYMLWRKKIIVKLLVPLVMVQSISAFLAFINFNHGYDKKGYYDASVITNLENTQTIIDNWDKTHILDKQHTRILMDDAALTESTVKVNGGLAFGINMPRIFHSVYNSQTNAFYDYSQGFVNETNNYWLRGFNNDALIHSLIATKGIISTKGTLAQQHLPSAFIKQAQQDKLSYYSNELYIGFAQKFNQYLTLEEFNQLSYMIKPQVLNQYLIVEESVPIKHATSPSYQDNTHSYLANNPNISWMSSKTFRVEGITVIQLKMSKEGTVYVPHNDNVKLFKNGQWYEDIDFDYYDVNETMTPISYQDGDIIEIQLLPGDYHLAGQIYQINDFAIVDVPVSRMVSMVQQRMLSHQDEQLLPNTYQVNLTLDEASLVYFAIPANEGWSAVVDYHAQDIIPVQGGFIGLMLAKGQHTVALNYVTPGFKLGLCISILSLILFIILASYQFLLRR